MPITRREVCGVFPALLPLFSNLKVFAAEDQGVSSGVFPFENAPMHVANNSAPVRLMLRGKLATGEGVEVHQTLLPPGGSPTSSTHHHPHSEMWLIREGTIELTVNDKKFRLEPGSVGFVRSNEEHGIRNAGTVPANYFVVAVGPGAELQT
jgi:mannose-6-phosphate isomerase-like protein (cupin superfamily)